MNVHNVSRDMQLNQKLYLRLDWGFTNIRIYGDKVEIDFYNRTESKNVTKDRLQHAYSEDNLFIFYGV